MTKLGEWLFGAGIFLGIWSVFLTKQITHPILDAYWTIVLYFPIIAVFLFGLYALFVVLWRVYIFNDCEDASKELFEQIKEARKDLKSKGFVFNEEKTS